MSDAEKNPHRLDGYLHSRIQLVHLLFFPRKHTGNCVQRPAFNSRCHTAQPEAGSSGTDANVRTANSTSAAG